MPLEELIGAAFNLASTPYHMERPVFTSATSIYMGPTSNVKGACKIVGSAESVLAVGGMGAIGYEMALNGAKKIDLFDINIFQKMYAELVKAAVMHLDYETFMKHFTLLYQNNMMPIEAIRDLLSLEIYLKLREYLPYESRIVYDYLYNNFFAQDLITSRLYRFEFDINRNYLKKFASLYNKKSYNIIQQLLRDNPNLITYQTASLTDIPEIYKDTYDAIILDNILQYHANIEGLETVGKVDSFVKDKLTKLLNPNGTIEVNYGYELRTAALKRMLNIPYNKKELVENLSNLPPYLQAMASDALTEKEMEEGLNTNLMHCGGYEYHFIPGVETEHHADNTVISYTRKM